MEGLDAERSPPLDAFWRFVAERQRIWVRRVVFRDEPPWTADAALRRHRFTNAYRLLDPGTQYAIEAILDREAPAADRVFNVLLYRLIGRVETHAHVGFQRLDRFDVDRFESALRSRREAGEPVFTGAYLVSGYAGMGGEDKVENVARLFGEVRDGFAAFLDELDDASGPEDAYAAIRSLPGFGNFLAYQALVDLTYPLPAHGDGSLLPFSANEWAAAGPGAKRGLELLGADADDRSELAWLRRLWRNQAGEFDRLGIDFDWLRDGDGERLSLTLADVQNCCCEYSKYHRVTTGQGRTGRRFRPAERRPAGALREALAGLPVSIDPDQYPAPR